MAKRKKKPVRAKKKAVKKKIRRKRRKIQSKEEKKIIFSGGIGLGRPLKFKNKKELEEKINDYFVSCWGKKLNMFGGPIRDKETGEYVMEQKRPYTITGLAVHLGTTRDLLIDYEDKEEFSDTIKKAKAMCHNFAEEMLFKGKNATGAIFNLKNNYGWKDKLEHDVTSKGEKITGINYIVPNGNNNPADRETTPGVSEAS